ncbi:hypothetical protein SEA_PUMPKINSPICE_124 [Streptomyces phage PumpkinSpice]|nr:hypothetical protein SEA_PUMPKINSPICE_124 [Streptomyces phage PumpkinSpice]
MSRCHLCHLSFCHLSRRGGPVPRGYVFAVLHISKRCKEGVDRTTETC